jgi:hypothetical protein
LHVKNPLTYDVTSSNVLADVKEELQKIPYPDAIIPVTPTLIKIMDGSKKEAYSESIVSEFQTRL